MSLWDIFISYSSDDVDFAKQLTKELQRLGVAVWLDSQQIHVGDSIIRNIEAGLANSRFGVVLLSPSFLEKAWTRKELQALHWRGNILPIWHKISDADISQKAPLLQDLRALNTEQGVQSISRALFERIFVLTPEGTQELERLTIAQAIATSRWDIVRTFFQTHPGALLSVLNVGTDALVRTNVDLGGTKVFLGTFLWQKSTSRYGDWKLVWLVDFNGLLFENERPVPPLASAIHEIDVLRQWLATNNSNARQILPDITSLFRSYVVVGERPPAQSKQATQLAELNDELIGTSIRTLWMASGRFAREETP